MTTSTTRKLKKSVGLSDRQRDFLRSKIEEYDSKFDAALALGINNDTLDRAIKIGSCAEATYNKLLRIKGFKELEA
jgi:hypothetical protein